MRFPLKISTRRLFAVVKREFNEIVRDPVYMSLALVVPPLVMFIFGCGLVLDIEHVPLGVLDRDQTQLSRQYVDGFVESDSFDLHGRYTDIEALEEDLRRSRIRAAIIMPFGFERGFRHGMQTEVQFLVDGTIPIRAQITRAFGEQIHETFLDRIFSEKRRPAAVRGGQVTIVPRIEFNSELRSANFVVPGLVATTLMYYPALLTTLSIVREKESQSILALYCSPITKMELLVGKLVPYLAISMVNCVAMFALVLYLFAVPFRGSVPLIATASVIYVFTTCSVGMLISVLVSSQVAAILVTMVLTLLPSFLYSGFFTPLSASSWSAWLIGRVLPPTYYLDVLRGVFLKGTGWSMHWPSLTVLVGYSAVVYGISFACFRKRLR